MNRKKLDIQNEMWQIAWQWLLLTGNKTNEKFCRGEITTHPDYPALISLTDFLDGGNMEYNAVQADASYINEFNYPVLAHISQPGLEYMHIIENATGWDAQKNITQYWSGIVIYAEKKSMWQHKDNEAFIKTENGNRLNGYLLLSAAIILLMLAILKNPFISYALMGLLSLAGLIVSVLISGTEFGVQSNIVKQVCGAVSKGGCDRVLRTNYAKGIAGFSIGDLSVLYFATQFLLFIASSINLLIFNTILLFCLPGILVAGWSIYTQAVLIKHWCALCLAIASILLMQFLIAVFTILPKEMSTLIDIDSMVVFAGVAALAGLLLSPVKKIININHSNAQKLAELKKWKMDAGIFIAQWHNEQRVDSTPWENDVIFGNPNAPIKIIVACNPYCGPCAKAHDKLEEILERHPQKVCIMVRFLCDPNDEKDRRTIFVKSYLQIRKSTIIFTDSQLALSDWFKEMDYTKWVKIWQPDESINIQNTIQQHQDWITKADISSTPTFFINGRKLHGRYELKELEALLPQLVDFFQKKL